MKQMGKLKQNLYVSKLEIYEKNYTKFITYINTQKVDKFPTYGKNHTLKYSADQSQSLKIIFQKSVYIFNIYHCVMI